MGAFRSDETYGGIRGGSPPTLKKIAVSQGKNGRKSISAGQLTGPITTGELLLLKQASPTNKMRRAKSDTPQNVVKLRPWPSEALLWEYGGVDKFGT